MKENMWYVKHITATRSFFPHQNFQYLCKWTHIRVKIMTEETGFQNTHRLKLPSKWLLFFQSKLQWSYPKREQYY